MRQFIEWSDAMSVGIEEIDNQHKLLVGMVNEIHDALQSRQSGAVVGDVLTRLADYTRVHFAAEEGLMRIIDYPGYESHKAEHEDLTRSVVDLQHKVAAGKTTIGFELMYFLKGWLTDHIMWSDQQYVECFIDAMGKAKCKQQSWVRRLLQH